MKNLIKILQQIVGGQSSENDLLTPKIPALLEEIEDERIKNIVIPNLFLIEEEIKELFSKIKQCENVEEAQNYFDLLQRIQAVLARLVYKLKVNVTQNLEKFIFDFDRIDDQWLRNHMFLLVKKGNY